MEFKNTECKFGANCTRKDCSFLHPDGKKSTTTSSINCKFGTKCKKSDCKFEHPERKMSHIHSSGTRDICKFGTNCTRANCSFQHPDGKLSSGSTTACKFGSSCTRTNCSFEHPDGKMASGLTTACKFGTSCTLTNCPFEHSDGDKSQLPSSGGSIILTDYLSVHPDAKNPGVLSSGNVHSSLPVHPSCTDSSENKPDPHSGAVCSLGVKCDDFDCYDWHPNDRTACCADGANCNKDECPFLHPQKHCKFGDSCYNYKCTYRHSAKRQVCNAGKNCQNFDCILSHPPSRGNIICKFKNKCFKIECPKLHPPGHKVCHLLEICFDINCHCAHPPARPAVCPQAMNCSNTDCEQLHPEGWDPSAIVTQSASYLKHIKKRQQERITAGLPILNSQLEFIQRVKRDKVVIVTAETGSGKTTQLPQYCAEEFNGLIVCTQPRAVAAISIAQRIAQEFDGTEAGKNVGYTVGGGKTVQGERIMLMTDSALVRMAQNDTTLSQVSVLMIDEAHERSLNTDIVLGISKLIREKREKDFYIVIASATIDPKPFLEFFFGKSTVSRPLEVPGRTFPVELEYASDIDDDDDDMVKSGYLIKKVFENLKKYQEGHCLVFLPGSNEVDNALRQFTKDACHEWIGFPLYGSLPPEEQTKVLNFDDCNGTLRMVIFCTNIAETSLTVPNVRLVIDTGLAKEARYDPKRRITVLELVYISKSSAEQRKGRAGRTAAGHCIRLYKDEWLEREHITPEILRSSLDLVMLQLCKIDCEPTNFPFINSPDKSFINSSLKTLQQFGCLDARQKITEKGKVFIDLPFDPRLSHFVVSAHEQYGKGEMASHIAAILSAPGSIFFMGGGKEGRNELKKRVADEGASYESDLLYLQSIYHRWYEIGRVNLETLICNNCAKKLPSCKVIRNSGCQPCRRRHCTEQGLNNKIMEIILKNVELVTKILKGRCASRNVVISDIEVVGRCLLGGFEDQIGQMVLPHDPKAGAYLVSNAMKVHLSSSTALAIARAKTGAPLFFISMVVTQIPNGMTIAEQAHPIHKDWLTHSQIESVSKKSLQMVQCYIHTNLNKRFLKYLQNKIPEIPTFDGLEQFISCYYDYESDRNAVCVSAPKEISAVVNSFASKVIETKLKAEQEFEQVILIDKGSANATVIGGLRIHALEQIGVALRVTYIDPPVKDSEQLKIWIVKKAKISVEMIKWCHYYASKNTESAEHKKAYGIAVFRDKMSAEKASIIHKSHRSANKEQEQMLFLKVQTDGFGLKHQLENLLPNPVSVDTVGSFSLKLCNIPLTPLDDMAKLEILKYLEPLHMDLTKKDIQVHNDLAFINLPSTTSQDECLQVQRKLQESPLGQFFQKEITTKKGHKKLIQIQPQIQLQPILYRLVFATAENAEQFVTNNGHMWPKPAELYATSKVRVDHSELYDLDSLARQVANKYGIQFTIPKTKNVIEFTGLSPKQVGLCAQTLQSYVCPLKIQFGDRKQKVFITELYSSQRLSQHAAECGVFVEPLMSESEEVYGLSVFGPQFNQGQFMSTLGEHCNDFDGRYKCIPYDSTTASIFQMPSAGFRRLQSLEKENVGAKITFLRYMDSIEILIDPSIDTEIRRKDILKSCKDGIDKIVKDLCGVDRRAIDLTCVKCQQIEGRQLYICGHPFCNKCRNTICQEYAKVPTPNGICCPLCSELISIKDIRECDMFDDACIASAREFLKINPNHPLAFCPQNNCTALLLRSMEYGQCKSCQSSVCVKCKVVDNPMHNGKNCNDFKKAIKFQKQEKCFESIFRTAKAFVDSNWSCSLGEPLSIDENPGIEQRCPAMIKYCNALSNMGWSSQSEANTLFAWHGTSSDEAIVSICHYGFDPARRSGQAYGTGEYFGQTPDVSRGYARGTSRLIVALLLRGQQTTTHGNFCYVVNNPTDWKMSFCLPVLVVTYGANKCQLPFITDFPLQKLPHHLFRSEDFPEEENSEDQGRSVQCELTERSNWISPYRWHWKTDSGDFQPYTDEINGLIEKAHDSFQSGIGPGEYETPPLIRFVDDRPQSYRINFKNMTQINTTSGYIREVSRKEVRIQTNGRTTWQYSDGIVWNSYDSLTQGQIESSFQNYMNKCGPSRLDLYFPGRPEMYELSFAQGHQINKQTGAVRYIRRI